MATKETKTGEGPEQEQEGTGGINKQMLLTGALLAVAIVAAGFGFYYYNQYSDLKVNPQRAAQEETRTLVERVSKLIVLPQDELPTIATVSDPEQLQSQPFFRNAKAGDKVLIYANARKAVLYSPTDNKIVEVAPLNIGETAGASTESDEE
jgi:hypothetical protein